MTKSWKITLLRGMARVVAFAGVAALIILAFLAVFTALPFVLAAIGAFMLIIAAGGIDYQADEMERLCRKAK